MPISAPGYTTGTLVDWTDASGSKYQGPPRSGSFTGNNNGGGNFGFDSDGVGWYCYESGTPGRWTRIPDGSLGGGGANTYDTSAGADNGQQFRLFGGARKEQAFSLTAAGNTPAVDCSNFRTVSVQLTSQGTGAGVGFQGSNDGTNWTTVPLAQAGTSVGGLVLSTGSTGIFAGPVNTRYFRITVNGITAGATAGVIEFTTLPFGVVLPAPNFLTPNADGVAATTGSLIATESFNLGWNGTTWDRLAAGGSFDAVGANTQGNQQTQSKQLVYDGVSWRNMRTPTVFKQVPVTSIGTTGILIWTPAAGKKFRLMGYRIDLTPNATAATAGIVNFQLTDQGTNLQHSLTVYVPTTTTAGSLSLITTGNVLLGNGVLSAAANNALFIISDTALPTGALRVIAFGTEE